MVGFELCVSSKFKVFLLLMTILRLVGDHPWVGGAILGMVEDHPWQFLPGVSFVSKVQMPNSKNVVYFLLVGDLPLIGG